LKTFLILRKAMNKRVVPINGKVQARKGCLGIAF
jgi:hypothetical protein